MFCFSPVVQSEEVHTLLCHRRYRGELAQLVNYMSCVNTNWLLQNLCNALSYFAIFTPQLLRAVGVLFSPMVSGWAGKRREKFVRAVSQKP